MTAAYEGLDLALQHAAKIASSAISAEVAEQRGYRTIHTKSQLAELGFGRSQQIVPTLLVPVWSVTGEIATRQHRPDSPRERKAKGSSKSKIVKYETPDGSRMVLDVPPGAHAGIGDPKVSLWITEGVLKADAAVSAGLCCVAVLGVWNWRGANSDGGKTALADWESVALNDRQVFIVYDSDVMTKRAVHDALARLGALLTRRGAEVAYVYLPQGDSGAKTGLDDFLAAGGTADGLRQLARTRLAEAETSDRAWPSPQDPMAVARRYLREYSAVADETTGGSMTGPEHHREAEDLLAEWWRNRNDTGRAQQFMPWLAAAQVHALLALAAAGEAGSGSQTAAQSTPAKPQPWSLIQKTGTWPKEEYPSAREAKSDLRLQGDSIRARPGRPPAVAGRAAAADVTVAGARRPAAAQGGPARRPAQGEPCPPCGAPRRFVPS